ncbi:hypothetical protein P0D71_00400 [Paraburkholderia sp. RL17-383-BIF-A]|uniref:hypothetical protein n=1 Tax=Paraburkholderia sp. RL17-383-BIF-A TaxID=3031631 RepID=UPI0038BDFE52
MNSFMLAQLVLLLIVAFVSCCLGFILGSLLATGAQADRGDPLLNHEFEHESDAHCYPRIGD